MIEEHKSFSFQSLLDDIKDYSKTRNVLRIGFPQSQNNIIIQITADEIEAYENQYMLAYIIKS